MKNSNSISLQSFSKTGLYTLIVYNDHNELLLYKQISDQSSFSVAYPIQSSLLSIILFHNQWIGIDEVMKYPVSMIIPQEKKSIKSNLPKKKKPKKQEAIKEAKNQDEVDLLNFISWEDESKTIISPHQPFEETKNQPINSAVNLDSFLNSLFS